MKTIRKHDGVTVYELPYVEKIPEREGFRICYLEFVPSAFNSAMGGLRRVAIEYAEGLRFNIVPPEFPKYGGTVYDFIWEWRNNKTNTNEVTDENTVVPIPPEDAVYVSRMPCGVESETLSRYRWEMPPSGRNYKRLTWRVGCSAIEFPDAWRWLHPWQNRHLSYGELCVLFGYEYLPETLENETLPPTFYEWLDVQLSYTLSGGWKEQDFSSVYDGKKWHAKYSHDERVKTFDMKELRPNNIGREFPFDVVNQIRRWKAKV